MPLMNGCCNDDVIQLGPVWSLFFRTHCILFFSFQILLVSMNVLLRREEFACEILLNGAKKYVIW